MFVGEGELGEGLAEVPGEVGGEQAAEDVGPDALFQVVPDGAEIEVVDFDDAEIAFDEGEVFVGGDGADCVQHVGGRLVRRT
ncbi:MAG: hypothetical protein M3460_30950 [Actinomycetota bacterium]|nr:hypothetical protein [Actinomycetota bacterium]